MFFGCRSKVIGSILRSSDRPSRNIDRVISGHLRSVVSHLWPMLFALTVWWCWKWRCGYVFGEEGKCRDRVQFLKDKAQEVISANVKLRKHVVVRERVKKHISWLRPVNGWFKLNTDGASRGNPGFATTTRKHAEFRRRFRRTTQPSDTLDGILTDFRRKQKI